MLVLWKGGDRVEAAAPEHLARARVTTRNNNRQMWHSLRRLTPLQTFNMLLPSRLATQPL